MITLPKAIGLFLSTQAITNGNALPLTSQCKAPRSAQNEFALVASIMECPQMVMPHYRHNKKGRPRRPNHNHPNGKVAEEQGFEPWEDFHLRRFSRPVHSTTLPLLRHR